MRKMALDVGDKTVGIAVSDPLNITAQGIMAKNFGDTCEVRTAKTGRAVIEIAEEFRPDIAILDIQMPGINGIEAIEEIKTFCPRTCFIIMSAYDTFDYAKKAMSLGVMDFITKPANTSRIVSALEKAMDEVRKQQRRWEKVWNTRKNWKPSCRSLRAE